MSRSHKQILASLESFAKTGAQQWDKAAFLAFETVEHYWNKGNGDSSLVVQLDAIMPRINGNIAKAYRLVIAELTAIKLCKDVDDEDHGKVSKNKRKKMLKGDGMAQIELLLSALATGNGVALKAFLPTPKASAPKVAKSFADTLKANGSKYLEGDDELSSGDLVAAMAQLDAMKAVIQAKMDKAAELLDLDSMQAPEGLEAAAA
jgi:hypothetical protein